MCSVFIKLLICTVNLMVSEQVNKTTKDPTMNWIRTKQKHETTRNKEQFRGSIPKRAFCLIDFLCRRFKSHFVKLMTKLWKSHKNRSNQRGPFQMLSKNCQTTLTQNATPLFLHLSSEGVPRMICSSKILTRNTKAHNRLTEAKNVSIV